MATSVVAEKGEINNMWADLEDVPNGRILMSLSWLATTKDKSVLQESLNDGLNKCMLQVYVDCCHDLKSPSTSSKTSSKPSPIVELQVGQGESQSTWPQDFTTEPVFESSFVFMISNPHVDDLHIKIIDSGHKNAVIGTTTIRTSDIMAQPDMSYSCQCFNLKGVTGKEVIKLALSVLCLSKAAPSQEESLKKQSTVSEPLKKKSVIDEAVVTEVPQEELENKTNEDLVFAEQVPADKAVLPIPALDQMLASTIAPIAKISTAGNELEMDTFLNRETELRQRIVPGVGKIKLTLKFCGVQNELTVIVYEAKGLPGGDLPDPPDPYVKLYLLPDRSKKSKRKTDFIKDTVTPVFNETFEYEIPALKIPSHQLEVSVVDRKGVFSRGSTMGRCVIDLDQVTSKEINQKWFDLIEVDEDSD